MRFGGVFEHRPEQVACGLRARITLRTPPAGPNRRDDALGSVAVSVGLDRRA
jgi:hypothetical protein